MLPAPSFHHLHLNSVDPDAAIDFYTRQFASTSKTTWNGIPALRSPTDVLIASTADLTVPALLAALGGAKAPKPAAVVIQQPTPTGLSLVRLPGQMERTLNRIESGSVQVQTDLSPLTERLDRQNRYASRLAWALVAAGAGITGAILRVGGFPAETRVAWGIAGVALVLLLGNALFTRTGSKGRRRAPHPTFRRSR